tara:strand:+ start:488 stop:1786 length:1299 start_codon:yes stop_codon:yes gene_type:complete
VIKLLSLLIIISFLNNCSFDTRSGIWTQEKEITKSVKKNVQRLFKNEIVNENEFNKDLVLKISNNYQNSNIAGTNNFGYFDIDLKFNKISKYKFSKIKNFDRFDPELIFFDNDLIFFDNRGSIIRFSDESKIIWKKNFYNKSEKKMNPILNFDNFENMLLVTDNLSKYYLVDINDGKLLWSKDHKTNFISEIKIDNDKFYALDSNNTFLCFSLVNGDKLWEFQFDQKLINSQKKTSIIFNESSVFLNNSKGEIISLDKENGELIWLTPIISYEENLQSFLIKTSELVLHKSSIYFSNNKNKFYSLDTKSGIINWNQSFNSFLQPVVIDDIVLSISNNGYLYIIQNQSGNIIRITDIFSKLKTKKRKKIQPIGFVVSQENIYLTTNIGKLFVIKISDGKQSFSYKISRNKTSKPYINNKKLYVVKDNEIIRLN